MNVLPDNILRHMRPKDRAALGKAGMTAAEATRKCGDRLERDLQRQVEQWLRLNGYWFTRQRMDKRSTARTGTPDFIVCSKGGKFVALECKVAGRNATVAQTEQLHQIFLLGGVVSVVRVLEDAILAMRFADEAGGGQCNT